MRNKQKGRDTGGDMVKAIKTEALVNAGVIDESAATDFQKLEATLDFVEVAEEATTLGLDFSSQLKDLGTKSADDLDALTSYSSSISDQASLGLDVTSLNAKFINDSSLSTEDLETEMLEAKELSRKISAGETSAVEAQKNVDNQNAASGSPEMRALLDELNKLNLSEDELAKVLKDLNEGPQVSPPGSPPSSITSLTLMDEVKMLTLLEDLTIDGKIDSTMFMASEQALASVFFQDLVGTYDALSALDQSSSTNDAGQTDSTDDDEMVLGGRKVSIGTGNYDLVDSASSFDYLIAATDTLTLLGDVVFNASSDATLILLSAQSIDLSETNSIAFSGDELGIGSFDSLNIEKVDLKAEGTLSLRSLDSIVLKNSAMETAGKGADFIHLLAANQITADSVQFSAMVKQITMEAMTINLSNINFPSGSNVNLNSLYGGIDGKYPSFGTTTQYGRVNFIQGMSYGSNPVMNRTNFDLHGGNIKIGNSGN
tara:strand:- start:4526 stop:5983 length:1458 start_codon:yes stop_codon:yes gene_type:complete